MKNEKESYLVTGAFNYTGKYISRRLIQDGKRVRTITNHPDNSDPNYGLIEIYPFSFDNFEKLTESFKNVKIFFNTFWVRYSYKNKMNHEKAVENSIMLFKAAKKAGVQKIVHISITNPSIESTLPYFKGKAIVEEELIKLFQSYSIIRPTIIYSLEDVLISNIAWLLRKFPIFPIFGDGKYMVQPVFINDLVELVISEGMSDKSKIIDSCGPEKFTYRELVELISTEIKSKSLIFNSNPYLVYILSKPISFIMRDNLITLDEIKGLMSNLLISEKTPTGKTIFSEWLRENASMLGLKYKNDLVKHYHLLG